MPKPRDSSDIELKDMKWRNAMQQLHGVDEGAVVRTIQLG